MNNTAIISVLVGMSFVLQLPAVGAQPCLRFDRTQVIIHPDPETKTIAIYERSNGRGPEIGHIELSCDLQKIEKSIGGPMPNDINTLMVRAVIAHPLAGGFALLCTGETLTLQDYAHTKSDSCLIKRVVVK